MALKIPLPQHRTMSARYTPSQQPATPSFRNHRAQNPEGAAAEMSAVHMQVVGAGSARERDECKRGMFTLGALVVENAG